MVWPRAGGSVFVFRFDFFNFSFRRFPFHFGFFSFRFSVHAFFFSFLFRVLLLLFCFFGFLFRLSAFVFSFFLRAFFPEPKAPFDLRFFGTFNVRFFGLAAANDQQEKDHGAYSRQLKGAHASEPNASIVQAPG